MAQTKQGSFDIVYHHIEAPTNEKPGWRERHEPRKLQVGSGYRTDLLTFLEETLWTYKRKLDGENMRVYWDGEQALWNGKSNSFNCGAELQEYMNNTFLEEIFEEKFGRKCEVVLFGEHMGPKVQGNELGLDHHEFVLFDVCINGYWQPADVIKRTAEYFNIKTCYDYMDTPTDLPSQSLENLIKFVAAGNFDGWEGIVATPIVECRDQDGERVIVKIKNRDYNRTKENQ